jgi:hypothetical protein
VPYWVFFAGSLAAPDVEPVPAWSLEPELEDEGEDGAGVDGDDGVAGLGLVLRLGLEGEDGLDGDVIPPEALPEVLPEPDVRSAPRSQAAIMLAPNARDTATARV